MRLADAQRAVHEIGEVVVASSQAPNACGDRIASYATALGGRCIGAPCAGNARSGQILPIHKPADSGRKPWVGIAIRFTGVIRSNGQRFFGNSNETCRRLETNQIALLIRIQACRR